MLFQERIENQRLACRYDDHPFAQIRDPKQQFAIWMDSLQESRQLFKAQGAAEEQGGDDRLIEGIEERKNLFPVLFKREEGDEP